MDRNKIDSEIKALQSGFAGNDAIYMGKRNGIEVGYLAAVKKYEELQTKYDNILATEDGHESGHEAATEKRKGEFKRIQQSAIHYANRKDEVERERNALQAKCERYEKALKLIEQMSDPGSEWKAICNMKSIASNALAGDGKKEERQWWEGKTVDELPEYVQVISKEVASDTGVYCKVFKWSIFGQSTFPNNGDWGAEIEGYEPDYLCHTELNFPGQVYGRLHASHLLPATEADYNAYLKTLTPNTNQ